MISLDEFRARLSNLVNKKFVDFLGVSPINIERRYEIKIVESVEESRITGFPVGYRYYKRIDEPKCKS